MKKQIQKLNKGVKVCIGKTCYWVSEPAKKRYHQVYHPKLPSGNKNLFIDSFFVLLAIGLLLWVFYLSFVFDARRFEDQVDYKVSISSDEIISGEEVTVRIDYKNNTDYLLKDVGLRMIVPEGFKFVKAVPISFSQQEEIIPLGNLEKGESSKIEVTYLVLQGKEEKVHLSSILNFSGVDKKNIDFYTFKDRAKSFSQAFRVQTSPVIEATNFPVAVPLERKFSFMLSPRISSNVLEEEICLWRPKSLTFFDMTPLPKDYSSFEEFYLDAELKNGEYCWLGSELSDRQIWVQSKGILKTEEDVFKVSNFFLQNGGKQLNNSAEFKFSVKGPNATVSYSVNGKRMKVLSLEEKVAFEMILSLEDFVEEKNANLVLPFPSTWLDKSSLEIEKGVLVEDKIFWKVEEETQSFSFLANLLHKPDSGHFSTLTLSPYLENFGENDYLLSWLSLPVNTGFDITASARYFTNEGDQLGRGPIPPKVGHKTSYWVFFETKNLLHLATDTKIKMSLPQNVKWTGKSTHSGAGKFRFNAESRELTYSLGETSPELRTVEGGLELEILPTEHQEGFPAVLIENIMLKALDSKSQTFVEKEIENIETHPIFRESL